MDRTASDSAEEHEQQDVVVKPRDLLRFLGAYVAVVLLIGIVLRQAFVLKDVHLYYASLWRGGKLLERHPVEHAEDAKPSLDGMVTLDTVTGAGPILSAIPLGFMFGVVSGRDGVEATFHDRTVVITPDDLLQRQAYDHGINQPGISLSYGLDIEMVYSMIADRLKATPADVKAGAKLRRFRIERRIVGQPAPKDYRPDTLTRDEVKTAAIEAARFLARGQKADGTFRYIVDAATNATLPGYDWPRHAGATYFLATAAAASGDAALRSAALRGAAVMRDRAMLHCGDNMCIGEGNVADLGSSALAILTFVELVRTNLDVSYTAAIKPLAAFIRSQQRADGEFMHEYDRVENKPIDVQRLYFTGEASFAMGRANRITGDPADLDSAARSLAHLVGPAWSFFGDRYYFGEEHWTCQSMGEIWDRAPNAKALDFCERWQSYGRKLQFQKGETPYDAEGAYGVSPLVTPRLTPVGSRSEAGVATLAVEMKSHAAPDEIAALDLQLRKSIALVMRQQFNPGPVYDFANPNAVHGAMPGSAVDWQLRIDYAQHSGSAMLRWLEVTSQSNP